LFFVTGRYRGALSFPPDAPALELALVDAMGRLEFGSSQQLTVSSPGSHSGGGSAVAPSGSPAAPVGSPGSGAHTSRSALPGNPEFYALSMSAVTDAFLSGALDPQQVIQLGQPELEGAPVVGPGIGE
jgi:hypothetical protein